MIAAAAAPTTRVSTMTDAWTSRLKTLIGSLSERLPDRKMNAPAARLLLAVHDQPRDWVELIAEVEADRTDRRLVAKAGADRVTEIAQIEAERIGPDVAGVEEQHAAEVAAQDRA